MECWIEVVYMYKAYLLHQDWWCYFLKEGWTFKTCVCVCARLVTQLCPALCDRMDCIAHQAPLSMGILQARILEWVAMPSSRGSSQPRDKPRSPALQVDSLPSEPPGKARQDLSHHQNRWAVFKFWTVLHTFFQYSFINSKGRESNWPRDPLLVRVLPLQRKERTNGKSICIVIYHLPI